MLAIPFLMFMSNSIFFDSAKVFNKPGSLNFALMLIWLTGLWLLALSFSKKKPENKLKGNNFNLADGCILGLVLISIINLIRVLLNYPVWDQVFEEFISLFSLFAGYFIIKDWFSRNDPDIIMSFLFTLVVINSIACLFYFLNQGLHFNIYIEDESQQEIFDGQIINRGFYFMPQFILFSIIFCLIFRKNYPIVSWPILGVNLLALFVTFTRSFLIIVILIFLAYFIFMGLKKKQLGIIFKDIFIYGVLAIVAILVISKVFPTKTKYFQERFTELTTKQSSSIDGPNNLEYRFMHTNEVISKINLNKKILGMGPVSEKQSSEIEEMKSATSDMAWTGVIFRWGFVGLTLFAMLFIFSFFAAFKLFLNSEGIISNLAILFLLYLISQILESFVSWTFMSGHGLTTGLWYFALLSAILKFNKTPHFVIPNKMSYVEEL